MTSKDEDRERRLADALRANLKRRKQQQRATDRPSAEQPEREGQSDRDRDDQA